jgi:hypothetical protein
MIASRTSSALDSTNDMEILPVSSFIRDVKLAMISPLALLNRRDVVISRDATRGLSDGIWYRQILHQSRGREASGTEACTLSDIDIDHAKRICVLLDT